MQALLPHVPAARAPLTPGAPLSSRDRSALPLALAAGLLLRSLPSREPRLQLRRADWRERQEGDRYKYGRPNQGGDGYRYGRRQDSTPRPLLERAKEKRRQLREEKTRAYVEARDRRKQEKLQRGKKAIAEREARLDGLEADHVLRVAETAALECPGVALYYGLARRGEEPMVRFEKGFADIATQRPIRSDTIYRIFSMTKPIVAASLLPLIERGDVALSDPVMRWLPEFDPSLMTHWVDGKSEPLPDDAAPILVLDVLCHTSGLFYPGNPANGTPGVQDTSLCDKFLESGVRQAANPSEFAKRLASVPLAHLPGAQFTYSPATALIACIAEAVTGMPYDEYLDESLLSPLGMKDTGFYLRDQDQRERLANVYLQQEETFVEAPRKIFTYERGAALNADGGMFASIEDYARFVRFLASDGMGIVDRQLMRSAIQDKLALRDLSMPSDFLGFPAGFSLTGYVHPRKGRICGWSGLANTHFWFDAHRGRYAILMAQKFPFSWRYQQLLTHHIRRWLEDGREAGRAA